MQNLLFDILDKSQFWFRKEECSYFIIDTEKKAKRLSELMKESSLISLDVETTGLSLYNSTVVGFSVCMKEGLSFYIPVNHKFGGNLSLDFIYKYLKEPLETIPILGHNLKFDYKFMLATLNINLNCVHDTFIMLKLEEYYDVLGLKPLCEIIFNYDVLELSDILKNYKIEYCDLDMLTPEEMYEYCCQDTDLTLRLFNYSVSFFNWEPGYIYKLEIELIYSLAKVEMRGVRVSKHFLNTAKEDYEKEVYSLETKIRELLDVNESFNLDSNVKVASRFLELYPFMRKWVKYTEKSEVVKLNEECLSYYKSRYSTYLLDHSSSEDKNIFSYMLDRKKVYSMLTKYISPWIDMIEERKTDFIYTNFSSMGADTGRMSSNDPSLHNVTLKVRHALVPRKGFYFISMDFDQVEYRILAGLAKLDHIIDDINNGADIHKLAAALLFNKHVDEVSKELRDRAKAINFGILYGMGTHSLAKHLGVEESEAEKLQTLYKQRFLRGTSWFNDVISFAKKTGYVLTSYGRKRRIPNIDIKYDPLAVGAERRENARLFGQAKRKAINTPIQGTSADIIKKSLNNVFCFIEKEGLDIHPLIIVHDDILYEVNNKYLPEDIIPRLKNCMEMKFKDKVNLTVDCNVSDISWGALKG